MKTNKGFTLIELLVVVLIIGILAGVALPQYTKAVEKSRATEAITLLSNLAKAEEVYSLGMNYFTNDMNALDIQMPNTGTGIVTSTRTNAFTITILNADKATTFRATATRGGSSNAGSPEAKYTIVAYMPKGESLQMWCQPSSTTVGTAPVTLGTTAVDKICKSISNGDAQGRIMKK